MTTLILVVCTVLAGGTIAKVVRSALAERAAHRRTRDVREFVDAFARELHVGAQGTSAVRTALEFLPDGDLRHTLDIAGRRIALGEAPGAIDTDDPNLAHVFRLWQISRDHGLGLGHLADLLVEDLDAHLARHASTLSAMAGARLTVAMLLALPTAAVFLGQSMGFGTVGFLLFHPIGEVLLLVGVLLCCGGVYWAEAMSVAVLGGVGSRAGPVARHLDIFAAGLSAGLPQALAWGIASSDGPEEAKNVSALLQLGAGGSAWEQLKPHPLFGPVAHQAAQQTRAGTSLARGVRAHATRLRATADNEAAAGAEKVLVALAAPLTLCFLPAFVLVGLIPLVIGLAGISVT